jgi:hypothetical protein
LPDRPDSAHTHTSAQALPYTTRHAPLAIVGFSAKKLASKGRSAGLAVLAVLLRCSELNESREESPARNDVSQKPGSVHIRGLPPAPSEFLVECLQETGGSKRLPCVSGRWPLGHARARFATRARIPHPKTPARHGVHTKTEGTPPAAYRAYHRGACPMVKSPVAVCRDIPLGGRSDEFFLFNMQQAALSLVLQVLRLRFRP